MLKEKIKKIIEKQKESGDKKKIENMIIFIIILIITIIAINAIWNNDNKNEIEEKEDKSAYKILAEDTSNEKNNNEDIEEKLELILSKMEGVGKVKVMITYLQGSEIVPMKNETKKTSLTQEEDSDGGKRQIEETDISTEIVYSSNNNPETETIINPIVKGAIIIAEGASNATIKSNIVSAVEAITGVATYRIQVFEMEKEK